MASFPPSDLLLYSGGVRGAMEGEGGEKLGVLLLDPITIKGEEKDEERKSWEMESLFHTFANICSKKEL